MNSSTKSILNEKLASPLYLFFSDCYKYPSNWMQSFYSLLYSSIPFKRLSRSALTAYYSSHTIHLLNKLETESKLALGSNTDFIIATSELLHSIELDTNCLLDKIFQDTPGVNEIYKLIRSLKTTYSSLSVEMLREDKKFKGNKEIASAVNYFLCTICE